MENRNSVLIVDDERANIVALTQILSAEYITYAAKNGCDAIEAAKEHRPDVILMDVFMPEMNGFQALAMLKKDEETKDIPVIFVTGLESPMNRERGMSLGAVDYILKPFEASKVRTTIRRAVADIRPFVVDTGMP